MTTQRRIPDWLRCSLQLALLGEIYPAIRAIAVGFSQDRALTLRMYLDREPNEDDYENLSVVVTNVLADNSSNDEITDVKEECVYSDAPFSTLDPLDGFVYARSEATPTI